MTNNKHKKSIDESSIFASSTYAGEVTKNYSNATVSAVEGMHAVENIANRLINVGTGQSQGNVFEYIEATKFNMDAAIKSSDLKAVITADIGRPHDPADIEILFGENVVREVQAKSYRTAAESLFSQSNSKYEGMQRLSPSEQYDRMVELAQKRIDSGTLKADDYQDTLNNIAKGLNHDGVLSPGTTREEAIKATTDTDSYIRDFKLDAVGNETIHAATEVAMVGGAICGAISISRNILNIKSGQIDFKEASINIAKDISSGGLRSAATVTLSTAVKDVAIDQGLGVLAKSNVATAVAVTAINVSKSILKYSKGEISIEDMTVEIGQNGASSVSGLYFGIVGAAVGGPLGALVGSMVGYTIANISYQTVIEIFKSSSRTIEEYERLRPIYEDAIRQLTETRITFEAYMKDYFAYSNKELDKSFSMIEEALYFGDVENVSAGLISIASIFGKELEFKTFEKFNTFMIDKNSCLKL